MLEITFCAPDRSNVCAVLVNNLAEEKWFLGFGVDKAKIAGRAAVDNCRVKLCQENLNASAFDVSGFRR